MFDVVVLHGAYFAYSGHRTCTGLPIPYVLPVTGEYSSTRLATRRVLE